MNRDSHLIFEAYNKRILSEMAIKADYTKIKDAIVNGLKGRTGSSYIFKTVADKTGKDTEEVVDMVVKPVIDALFPNGVFASSGEQKMQATKLQNAIQQELAKQYGGAVSGYTARIIKNFIANVIEIVDDEVEQGETIKDAQSDVVNAMATAANKSEEEVDKEAGAPEATPSETGMNALAQYAVEQVGDGKDENELINDIVQHIVQKEPEISEVRAKGRARGLLNNLISSKVLSKRGNLIEYGDKADEFAEKGDLSLVSAEPEEYLASTGLHGGRPKTGRDVFGGEDRYSGMFG
jgi:hypothetical protein